jgi:hypothetical protein
MAASLYWNVLHCKPYIILKQQKTMKTAIFREYTFKTQPFAPNLGMGGYAAPHHPLRQARLDPLPQLRGAGRALPWGGKGAACESASAFAAPHADAGRLLFSL